ncbi:TetR/AcrR family transcriptional regulator [Sulfitobacter sp. SK011]|jgi:AcrR family transcriptional regulator|uniref:TetR/AcrR family transcriptional regulator n=1 Tax=Sulfitobacter sp. SK011 TaxID=1389004 RepID=UPI000E0B3748|nr:TetR/AcrR family transcriptional regulator [Sulfitobacter sp. SK011]AXI41204.1 TetR/AcrR family transcriptional regulator [Sulfitobacter sp. SK011]
MAGKVEARKALLREALIDAAEAQIRLGGLSTLKARPLAQAAGCALGAIYNIFDDLDALVMAVNARTFRRLGAFVSARVTEAADQSPNTQLVIMSHAYLHFAADHTFLWRALFDLEMSVDGTVPEWYLLELRAVFGLIAAPLAQLFPDMKRDELDLMVRALFSAVHGIVLLGLERRISAVPQDQIETMLSQILREIGNS